MEYLRISLTDKCNLRCRYCMPDGVRRLQHEDVLTLEEVYRIAEILTRMGIRKIRLTGGEPLVRKGIGGLIGRLGCMPGRPELAMTTNGILLEEYLETLWENGLRNINVSLDTLDRETYRELTGVDALEKVERALQRAQEMGFSLKLNVVPVRGINDHGLAALAEYARDLPMDVRFIELMPMGHARGFRGMSGREVMENLAERFGQAEKAEDRLETFERMKESSGQENVAGEAFEPAGSPEKGVQTGPAEYYRFPGFRGRIGLISPLSSAFCRNCSRLRLTVDGKLKLCLYHPDAADLRELLRSGCSDEELRSVIQSAVMRKPEAHAFRTAGVGEETGSMYAIGG